MTTFLEIENYQCRFPIEGTGMSMQVCGAVALPGQSYCQRCRDIAYVVPTARLLKSIEYAGRRSLLPNSARFK